MKTILIADDDDAVLSTYARALQQEGFDVITAQSGDAALTLARQRLPDLVLTDVNMPGTDGRTVLQTLRQDAEMGSRPIVLMTGFPEGLKPRDGMNLGADDFLLKPVGREELIRCVRARLSRAEIHWRVEERTLHALRSAIATRLPHAFYTPLAGVLGLVQVLRADLGQIPTDEVADMLGDIERCGWRLHRTLRNYLLALEIKDAPTRSPMTAKEVIESVTAGIDEAAGRHQRGADVTTKLTGCAMLARPIDLSIAAEELVDNACSFSRPGTPIVVGLSAAGVFTVCDSGRGMTEQQIGRIMAFASIDKSGAVQDALGLGLSLVQGIAQSMGARFSLCSTPGQGTTAVVGFSALPAGPSTDVPGTEHVLTRPA